MTQPSIYITSAGISSAQKLLEKLAAHRDDYETTKACALDLLTNYLDDPTETEADLSRLQEQWDIVNEQASSKQARLDEAAEVSASGMGA